MPKLLLAALVVIVALAVGAAQGAAPAGNRAANGGAEAGTGSTDGSAVPVPGWATTGAFTVVQYGSAGYPAGQPGSGSNFFAGGPQSPSSAEQTIDLSAARKAIDAGRVDARVGALEAGPATFAVSVEDGSGHRLNQRNLKAGGSGEFERVDELIPIPPKARSATLTMKAAGHDALFDNVSLTLSRRSVPRPQRGVTVLVEPAKGVTVLLRRGNRKVITRPALVPLGTEIDTSKGTATIVSASDRFGAVTQRGSFSDGVFAVDQVAGDTEISLGGRGTRACNRPRRLVSRATSGFMVLAGASASRAAGFFGGGIGRAVWVSEDRCTAATIKTHQGRVEVVALGSRDASGQRAHHLFTTTSGHFRTRGRNSSATVRGRVVAAVDASTPPPQKKGATYTGITSQGKSACHRGTSNAQPCQVVDKVSKDGKKVHSKVYFEATCADGNVYQDSTVFVTLKITKGKYSASGSYDETLSDGTKVKNAVQTHGTFKRRSKKFSVVGDFRVASDVTFVDGSTTHCSSGKITFTAKAK